MSINISETSQRGASKFALISIFLCFFTMGFVDLVGIATNYVQEDFQINNTTANLLTSMVFFWFLVISVPTGVLMNKIGRKKTVLLSVVVTAVALLIPSIYYSFSSMIVAFSLLGIGNALMQVSLNPLLSDIVDQRRITSMLTFGQFIKAIASFSAPLIAARAALMFGNWKLLFPIFMIIAIIAIICLSFTQIEEKGVDADAKTSGFKDCFSLLSDRVVLLCFIGIVCHVGIDVGTNVTAPKLLIENAELTLNEAGIATSIYFLARLIGCLLGSVLLSRLSVKSFFIFSVSLILVGSVGLLFLTNEYLIYLCIACIGFGNSNIFSILFSQALAHLPNKKNEVSGLMIMGLVGGAIFPFVMGLVSDVFDSQIGAIAVLLVGVAYLISISNRIKK